MEAALGWLGDIIHFIIGLLPHIVIVRTTHAGVKFVMGDKVKVITHDNGMPILTFRGIRRTGIHFYWPLVTEYEQVPIKRQTTNLVQQYLVTSDGHTIGVSGIVVYRISNIRKLLTETWDHDDTIVDYSLAAIKEIICQNSLTYLMENGKEVDEVLTKKLRDELRQFGVKVIKATLSDLTPAIMIAQWGANG